MARIRTVKPEYWTDAKIVTLSPLARLLFIGLWNFADDYGRMPFEPLTIKLQILPLDPTDLSAELGELRRASLIVVYEVDGKHYLQVANFDKHQKVDKRSASKLPLPPPNPAESRRIPPNPADGREGKGKEGKGEEEPHRYRFAGKVIRLTDEDFTRWQRTYHAIPDFNAELTAIDTKFAADPPRDWYATLSGWLSKKHERLLMQRGNNPPGVPKGDYAKLNVNTIR